MLRWTNYLQPKYVPQRNDNPAIGVLSNLQSSSEGSQLNAFSNHSRQELVPHQQSQKSWDLETIRPIDGDIQQSNNRKKTGSVFDDPFTLSLDHNHEKN